MTDQNRLVKSWLSKAAKDLRTAKLLVAQNNDDFWESAVFHAQQSAEKAIKGYLTAKRIRFSKTHDIQILIEQVAKVDATLSQELEFAAVLTRYAVAYRYPEENLPPEQLNQAVCNNVIQLASAVVENLSKRISASN